MSDRNPDGNRLVDIYDVVRLTPVHKGRRESQARQESMFGA